MSSTIDIAPMVVVGIGNPMRGDDGVGPAAIDLLRQAGHLLDTEFMVMDGEATRLVEAWQGRRLAMVVDATVLGSTPGSIHRIEAGVDQLPGWSSGASSHSTGLADAVETRPRPRSAAPATHHLRNRTGRHHPGDRAIGRGRGCFARPCGGYPD